MRRLLALYPHAWRRRYGSEFAALLDGQPPSPRLILDVVLGAIDAHLDPQVADNGEESFRRRLKDVNMKGLRSRTVLTAVGLLLPVAMLVVVYLRPEIGHDGFGAALAIATALASGMLVGRWWAPLSFVVAWPVWLASVGADLSNTDEYGYFTVMVIAWAVVCLLGVGVRVRYQARFAHLGSSSA